MTLLHGSSGDLWSSNYQQSAVPAYYLSVHFTACLAISCRWTLRGSGLKFPGVLGAIRQQADLTCYQWRGRGDALPGNATDSFPAHEKSD